MLEITSVKVQKVEKENSKHKGTASVILNECFVVEGIRIIEGEEKLFLAMPSRKTATGHKDMAHPITKECREMFEKAILEEYNKQK